MITLILIATTVITSLAAWQRRDLLEKLIYWGPAVYRGQWWRFVSHGFIHADGAHLLFNMITLFFFGSIMERVLLPRIGAGGYLLFYLLGILIAVLPTHLRHGRNPGYRCLGASGAVSSVLFAYILLQPWAMLYVFFVPVPAIVFAAIYVVYSVNASRQGRDNINHSAHLWGGAWGVGFLLLLEPSLLSAFLRQLLDIPYF